MRARAARGLARRLWPHLEPMVHDSVLGPHIQMHAPPRLVRRDEPSYVNLRVVETAHGEGGPIEVGRYCSLNEHAYAFLGGNHALHDVSTFHFHRVMGLAGPLEPPRSNGPIRIGNDVWVGWEAAVMSGVTIGDGAVVAARAVVTKDVRPYEIVGGVPAGHIGWRFDEPTRAALLRIRWWDWPVETVVSRVEELQSEDVGAFVARYDPAGDRGTPSSD
ncbi:MAG TPA: CatB-related O-acetyltransferase [Acidimicrobiales bacterium]|nr:CatB-related O-acetyltransferase [Acidimicrobiales bacterium]